MQLPRLQLPGRLAMIAVVGLSSTIWGFGRFVSGNRGTQKLSRRHPLTRVCRRLVLARHWNCPFGSCLAKQDGAFILRPGTWTVMVVPTSRSAAAMAGCSFAATSARPIAQRSPRRSGSTSSARTAGFPSAERARISVRSLRTWMATDGSIS